MRSEWMELQNLRAIKSAKMEYPRNRTKKKHPELLAPAGSFETGRAVIHAGADAVYLGGSRFGARAYADNFSKEDLLRILDYAHLHDRKIYLTINTLLKEQELEGLYDYLLPYYEAGLDAVIVQDYGVMQLVHDHFPDLSIHISTQMSVASTYAADHFKQAGASRIVPARELSLDEIREIRSQSDIEMECFVHGALCYCYSGQCLLSSMLGGRSGNRGRCAQPCRLPYTVLASDRRRRLSEPDSYLLSLKDLCTIDQIGALTEAGIDSFKIEGRMKSSAYAAGVTAIYRAYIDSYLNSGEDLASIQVKPQDFAQLLKAGNRSGFTGGYYRQHNGPDMITHTCPSHESGNETFQKEIHANYVEKELKIPVHANAVLKIGQPAQLSAACRSFSASVQCGMTQAALKQPMSREMITAQLSRTGNTPFTMDTLDISMDGAVFLPKQELNRLRREALDSLTEQMLAPYRRKAPMGQNTADANQNLKPSGTSTASNQHPMYASVETAGQLAAILEYDLITRIYLDSCMYTHKQFAAQLKEHVNRIQSAKKQAFLILPSIFRMDTARFYREHWKKIEQTGIDGYLLRNQDELGFIKKMRTGQERCVLDHSLYTYSNHTKSCYALDGWDWDTVPLELNKKELLARGSSRSELLIYGHLPLMTSAQCIYQTLGQCEKKPGLCYLKDRYGKEFPVKNNCSECYNTIYNAQPLSLIQLSRELEKLHSAAYRLSFTIESPIEVQKILNCCVQSFLEHRIPDMAAVIGAYTNGHYKRGVE